MSKTTPRKSPSGFWFFPDDFLRDLDQLSDAAAGAWTKILCRMNASPVRGALVFPSGEVYRDADVQKICDWKKVKVELRRHRIYQVSGEEPEVDQDYYAHGLPVGAIYSRRMVRDTHINQIRSRAGKAGRQARDVLDQGGDSAAILLQQNSHDPPVLLDDLLQQKPQQKPGVLRSFGPSVLRNSSTPERIRSFGSLEERARQPDDRPTPEPGSRVCEPPQLIEILNTYARKLGLPDVDQGIVQQALAAIPPDCEPQWIEAFLDEKTRKMRSFTESLGWFPAVLRNDLGRWLPRERQRWRAGVLAWADSPLTDVAELAVKAEHGDRFALAVLAEINARSGLISGPDAGPETADTRSHENG